jgi:hypothetical protein
MVIRDAQIIAEFTAETGSEGAKNPARQADMFLKSILGDKTHDYHQDLLDGKLRTLSGHPEMIQPKTEMTI